MDQILRSKYLGIIPTLHLVNYSLAIYGKTPADGKLREAGFSLQAMMTAFAALW